ncbi:glycosyltransferase family 1 protein [Halarcobacter sp.]|uniref:glycosyltransferase family 4 protein n=1 Tax=Halarcobacter sp. TaxID=2321133 RepID=UPI0029F4FE18|nr:glycosyltransferase family 1 protein [Halarcobacter sp.]
MKILIDARVLTHDLATGVENYAKSIIANIPNTCNITIAKPKYKNKYYRHFWEHFILPFKIFNHDILFCPANIAPIFLPNKIKLILTLHDVSFITYKDSFSSFFRFYYNFLVPFNIKRANKIITVSNYSKNQITKYYPNIKNKIEVIYNGVDPIFKENKKIKKQNQILYVGSLNKRKNFNNLIKAFISLNSNTLKLKIVGNFSSNFKLDKNTYELLKQAKSNSNIYFLENVDNQSLVELYQSSKIFIYPSFYEGFGLPILESFSCMTPVICSNTSSLKEVAQDSALYCNPYDVDDIKNKIKTLYEDNALQESLVNKGKMQSSKFDWQNSALEHISLFKKVISEA